MKNPLLQINELEITAGEKKLVDGISLQINKNSVTGLVGESGSGKTLTALSIMGLLQHGLLVNSGEILYQTKNEITDLTKCPLKKLNHIRGNKIAMVFQEPMTSLNPSKRCGHQVIEPILTHKKKNYSTAKKMALKLFEEVRLPDANRIFNAWPHELSGGQRQRVMIAMALTTNPELLIADEPTTALDVTVQDSILNLLLQLKEKYQLSILFISHDLMVIKKIADEIAVMRNGVVVEHGAKEKILNNPESAYTKGLLLCRPGLDKQPRRLPTINDFINGINQNTASQGKQAKTKAGELLMSINKLNVIYPGKKSNTHAVRNVSFQVYRGETAGLVGESGCGKTSLGRAILQLIDNASGDVIYKGIALNECSGSELRKLRRQIQIVFQDPYSSLNPRKTIGNILREPMIIHNLFRNERTEQVNRLLLKVGLPEEAAELYPHQFSGGQRQRIGIARALACQPEFIILDESVSALDVSIQAQILNLLNDLKDEFGLTYIFISHDLTVVKYMSDRVYVMNNGEIIESGSAKQVYEHPENAYTKKLIDSIPV